MKYMICVVLGLLAASAGAEKAKSIAPPSYAQIQAVEQSIGGSMSWPERAKPISDYDRYYYWDRKGTGLLMAQFKPAKKPGTGRVFPIARYTGYVADGGCSIVNLVYFGKGDSRNQLRCGGR